jgi:3-methylornithyl-N6-L-lysine dehydrogenase
MTRLRSEDVEHIPRGLKAYDQMLLAKTGHSLSGVACHALELDDRSFAEFAKSCKVCVVPVTCGQGLIKHFCAAVSGIIRHLGFHAVVAKRPDVAGIAEALENKADLVLLADDERFVAINVHTNYISDNTEMTARGFVAGLSLMAKGLQGKDVLVIGCGGVGRYSVKVLAAMGVSVYVCDVDAQLCLTLQKEMMDEQSTVIQIDNDWRVRPGKYSCLIDATPSVDVIDASVVTQDSYLAVPGVPCGLSKETRAKLSGRYLHDPLQIGVACMVVDACKP